MKVKLPRLKREKKKLHIYSTFRTKTSGNGDLRGISCSNLNPLDEGEDLKIEEVNRLKPTDELNTPNYTTSVQRSPSVVSC